MSFFKNIFNSKLSIITFLVLPSIIILLVLVWIYILFYSNSATPSQEQILSSSSEINLASQIIIGQIATSSSNKGSPTKASFADLEKPAATSKPQSSSVVLVSPVASMPLIDAAQISDLLSTIESFDNSDDLLLDNQILEN